MLYITFSNSDSFETWEVGSDAEHLIQRAQEVSYITADGEELSWIVRNFPGIVFRSGKYIVRFYGNDAVTIVGNLG